MYFVKMHGCGNDYVYINCIAQKLVNRDKVAVKVSDRHFGIGADGLICIDPSDVADFKMDMYNADGSQGKMCGNGIRCVGKFVYDYGLTTKKSITIETGAGIKTLRLNVVDGKVCSVSVDMGYPELYPPLIPINSEEEKFIFQPVELNGCVWYISCVSMGNPHAVIFVDDVDSIDLAKIGPMFENHALFPERVNTEFVEVLDEESLKIRVWERGSGETLACGTGACASLVVSALLGKTKDRAKVYVRGGALEIDWDRELNSVYMTGPAEIVYEGRICL